MIDYKTCDAYLLLIILKIQSAFLLIFGFMANIIAFIVLIQPRLRRRPTFSYLAYLSLSNALLSLIHAVFSILGVYFNLTLENLPLIYCRFFNRFSIDFLTHFSLYTLTAVDIERIRAVTSKSVPQTTNHRRSRSTGSSAAFVRVCFIQFSIAIILIIINLHWLTSYGYKSQTNNNNNNNTDDHIATMCAVDITNQTSYYVQYLTSVLPIIECILFGIIPFTISVLATIIILKHVSTKYSLSYINNHLKNSRRRLELHLSILLISLNVVFILFTTPHNVYNVYMGNLHRLLGKNIDYEYKALCKAAEIQKILDLLQQCYFMSTFFLYILTNRRFREEFCDFFLCYKSNSSLSTNATTPLTKLNDTNHTTCR
ncbi:unnamed protein product [Didymodactylos carnosus]|uniref:G-protein coupled receptors family 1 profile domain-containing protein n=1 Tax=Didymodactylos carnosus TaxID=1234261 RepID=A0A815Y4U7_9BILA|nr:unnamed protein product [Didymodactylos carnosus]CAF1565370.1 unnamed protein product [Didymodactylos carnosus]CAF4272225.1 unnamed protein product [Didymodactylos carnosus]CAF4427450.1 unnamed protein product [Didymodactylos carnosus]